MWGLRDSAFKWLFLTIWITGLLITIWEQSRPVRAAEIPLELIFMQPLRFLLISTSLDIIKHFLPKRLVFHTFKKNFNNLINKKRPGPLHSLIRLSLWLQGIGTSSLPPSFRALTIFKPSKPGFTNTYASTLSLDHLSLLFGNARILRDSQGLHHSGAPLLAFDFIKKKTKKNLNFSHIYLIFCFLIVL